jgi:hypothetical protein
MPRQETEKAGNLPESAQAGGGARLNGWTVISMEDDWKKVFAFEP